MFSIFQKHIDFKLRNNLHLVIRKEGQLEIISIYKTFHQITHMKGKN